MAIKRRSWNAGMTSEIFAATLRYLISMQRPRSNIAEVLLPLAKQTGRWENVSFEHSILMPRAERSRKCHNFCDTDRALCG